MADRIGINIYPETPGKLAPLQRVTTTYRYDGTYHLDAKESAKDGAKGKPGVKVRLQVQVPDQPGPGPYDSTLVPATSVSDPDVNGDGTWYYDSNVPANQQGSQSRIEATLYTDNTYAELRAGPVSVEMFFVRNARLLGEARELELASGAANAPKGANAGFRNHTFTTTYKSYPGNPTRRVLAFVERRMYNPEHPKLLVHRFILTVGVAITSPLSDDLLVMISEPKTTPDYARDFRVLIPVNGAGIPTDEASVTELKT